jgi:UDP-glucose 4-epimerase
MVCLLSENGAEVVSLNHLSTGHRDEVPSDVFFQGDCGDRDILNKVFQDHQLDVVMPISLST